MTSIRDLPPDEQLQLFIGQIGDSALAITDSEGIVTHWSPSAQRLTGWTAAEMIGASLARLFTDEDRRGDALDAAMASAQRDGNASGNRWYLRKDGSRFLAEGKLAALRTADGRLVGFAQTLREATEALRSRESEAMFRAMVNATPHMVWSALPNGANDYMNERMLAFTGASLEYLLGHSWSDYVHPDDQAAALKAWMASLQTGEPYSAEFRFRNADGDYRWVLSRGEAVRDDSGAIVRWMGTTTDIHEQKTTQARLTESEELFRSLVTATSHVIWRTSPDGAMRPDQSSWSAFTGQTEAQCRGDGWLDALHPDDRDRTMAVWMRATRDGTLYETQYRVRHASGEYRWLVARGVPIRDAQGAVREWMGVNIDITEKKRIEQALQEARLRLEATLSASDVATWAWDLPGNRIYADQNMAALFGLPDAGVDGRPIDDYLAMVHADDREMLQLRIDRAIASREPFQSLYRVCLPEGSCRFIHARGKVEYGADGTALWLPGIAIDVTALKMAEEELRQREQRYRALFNAIEEGFCIIELLFDDAGHAVDHRYLEANAAMNRITGGQDMTGRHASEVLPDYDPSWRARYFEVLRTGEPAHVVLHMPQWRKWLDVSITRIGEEANNQVGVLVRDITRRKRNEAALQRREERYRALFNSIDEGFYIIELLYDEAGDPVNYRFLEANPATERINGLRDVLGKTLRDFVPSPQLDWIRSYDQVSRTGEPARFTDYSPALGRWFDVSATRIGEASTRQVAILFNDITERKRNEEELRRLAADLTQANRRQNEFLAMLAHELRNPLAPIRTGLDLIQAGLDVSPAVAKVHDVMDRQVDHLVHLVNELLDLARINSGKIELKKARHALADIVRAAIEISMPLITAKKHEFITAFPEEPIWINADENRLGQIISNLLTNAAKYTREGGRITLSLAREDDEAVISVADNGIGIAPDDLPHLFGMFSQLARGQEQGQGGLGIGLHLVKRLTEKHGGSILAESAGVDQGSSFTLRLPIEQRDTDVAAADALQTVRQAASKSLRILVADDNRDAAELLKELLEISGHSVRVVHDGRQALEAMRRETPDLALLDIGMPSMNGHEVAEAVRSDPAMTGVILAAITGWGMKEDRVRSMEAGFDHHLSKPVEFNELIELIARINQTAGRQP
ncbi:PAS domain S-box protein [Noviherbaspirillum pedocola]|uniref:histidine kinase n=1 Tax=Noviherbaspirillum pedocola TaxID=2801341 RepID=A0A934SW36_9BURK|nr:PAS domain S-box protein [Noviherbaspirillum pedocola]MBK4736684.1 PAS domain S-box protein [Noviherbaspirillum pedocola]